MTTVVNVRDSKADVYIGRGSKWGNPFKMESEADRDKVCEQYEVYFWTSGLFRDIRELVDKSLGCYCKPKRCHGDFLAEVAEFYKSHGYVNKSDFEASRKGAPQVVSKGDNNMLYILHQVNCYRIGAGFAGYIIKHFPLAEERFYEHINLVKERHGAKHYALGDIVEVPGDGFTIVHCFGQEFYGNSRKTGKIYTLYDKAEHAIAEFRRLHPDARAICPVNMGCGLAGGDWNRYSKILAKYNIIPCENIDIEKRTFRRQDSSSGSSESCGEPMQFRGKYWFLSNFYPCKITDPLDNLTFECVESAFQASKCAFPEDRKKFLGLNGAEAKKLGRSIRLRSDWNSIKVDRMCEFVSYKFYDEKLLKMLKAVDEPIVENNTWNDTFWGVCNGKGRNELGLILEYIKKGNTFDPVAGWLPTDEDDFKKMIDDAVREQKEHEQSHYKFIKVDGKYVLKASK